MDAKITLSFDRDIIERAKKYADSQNISLSRLMEFMLRKIVTGNYKNLEELHIADWVNELAAGKAEYITRRKSRKAMKNEFFNSRK